MASNSGYPVPGYIFKVFFDKKEMAFKEVSGLSVTVEYKTEKPGADSTAIPKKFDKVTPSEVTFKKGLVKDVLLTEEIFLDFFKLDLTQTHNEIKHRDVLVILMNEDEKPVLNFVLKSAYPTKWEISNFDAMSKELTIETIVLGCKRIEIKK